MKTEFGWKIITICLGIGLIACGIDCVVQHRNVNACRTAAAEQKAEIEALKADIQKAMAVRPLRGDMMRRRGGFQPPTDENGNPVQPPFGFQPPTDENGNPVQPPFGFQPPTDENGNPVQPPTREFGARSGDDSAQSTNAPRRPRRRVTNTAAGTGN